MCTGGLTNLASYNRFHNNVFFDIWVIGIVDFLTSIAVSALVFSAIGFVCNEMDALLIQFKLQGFSFHNFIVLNFNNEKITQNVFK